MTEITINRTCAMLDRCEQFTSGRVGARIKFSFSSEWAGLSKTAVFTNGDTTIDVLNVADEITIPHEVLAISGKKLKVGVYGYTIGDNGNIEIAIPTVYADLGKVVKGADPSGDESIDPTLPVWAQTQAMIGNLNALETSEKSNLVAAVNEVKHTTDGKQDKLIAGENITIAADGKTISATGGGGSVPKPLTYDYMPEGYPTKSVQATTLIDYPEVPFEPTTSGTSHRVILPNPFEIVVGKTYTVNWDGIGYECIGVALPKNVYAIGNLSIKGAGDDTGEPFLYIYESGKPRGQFTTLDTSASHTISVKTPEEIVTPMAEEFLPTAAKNTTVFYE